MLEHSHVEVKCVTHTDKKLIVTLPVEVVAKYCDEHVCLCVCLSTRISLEPHARSLPIFLCMMPMAVARSPLAG